MGDTQTQLLVEQLAAGFETLQDEYRKLFAQHSVVERKLATAREQYNELAKLYGSGPLATPPLSLSSLSGQHRDTDVPYTAAEILDQKSDHTSQEASRSVRAAFTAIQSLRRRPSGGPRTDTNGVKIWSGPSADRPEAACSSAMPSISESPLEQDFTIEGKPSRLGCPFASMSNKKLSSHAASVLSRYNAPGSAASSNPPSCLGKLNGRDSQHSQRGSRRPSFVDPIKAEICGLSTHQNAQVPDVEQAIEAEEEQFDQAEHAEEPENAEVGVCPIRFLDQHSPEELATYFERHKHELPRSHEVCVLRYQSNEDQIRELDAKYGNIVSMIQGLGAKHKDYLPEEIDPAQEDETAVEDAQSAEKVRKWATNVSVRATDGQEVPENDNQYELEEEDRQPHFERPLRDIRVGESPSRPWGISIPTKYLEKEILSEASSRPAEVSPPPIHETTKPIEPVTRPAGKCPFSFDKPLAQSNVPVEAAPLNEKVPEQILAQPIFVAGLQSETRSAAPATEIKGTRSQQPSMVFTGPVFIGYSVEDAAKLLRESGLGQSRP